MTSDIVIKTDILVIGGGMAGLYSAIKAREAGRNVTLADKAYVGKTGTSLFAFAHHTVFDPKVHDFTRWMNFIIRTGEYVNNRDWIEILLKESYSRYQELLSWGVPFLDPEMESLWHDAHIPDTDKLGVVDHAEAMIHKKWLFRLREKALEVGVEILDRVMVTDLVKQDDKLAGAVGFHTIDGNFYSFNAKAVIIATGAGTFKQKKTQFHQWHECTADGQAMSYRVGVEITGKEFGHMMPAGFKDLPMPTAAQAYSQERVFVNAEGEAYLKSFPIGTWGTMLGALFEIHAGRGPLFFDYDRITPEERKMASEFVEIWGKTEQMDVTGVDYSTITGKQEMMWGGVGGAMWGFGGIHVNTNCETNLPGLYAVGDSAGTRFCGSMYPGTGYGIAAGSVMGGIAAERAVQYTMGDKNPAADKEETARLKKRVYAPLLRKGGFSHSYVTELLRNLMVPYFISGVKHGERLQAVITFVSFIEDHLVPMLKASDAHELRMTHEVRNMALDAEMILRSSLFRTESRGTHYREDFPRRDDPNWLAQTILREVDGKMHLSKLPIPEEWWPDLSKPYEERYPVRFPGE